MPGCAGSVAGSSTTTTGIGSPHWELQALHVVADGSHEAGLVGGLGEQQEGRLAPGETAGDRQHELVAKVGAELAEAGQDLGHVGRVGVRLPMLVEPRLELGVGLDAPLEVQAGVGHLARHIGDRGVDEGVRRQQWDELRVVAQRHVGELRHHLLADLGKLAQQRRVATRVARPRDLLGHRHRGDVGVRDGLAARGEPGHGVAVLDPHLALEDGYTRPLGAGGDGEHRALDRDLAVRGVHPEVAALALLGGLDDDAAAPQRDRHPVPSRLDGELGVLVHLDAGAVAEAQDRPRGAAGADHLRGGHGLGDVDRKELPAVDAEECPVDPLGHRPCLLGRALQAVDDAELEADADDEDRGSREPPPPPVRPA